TPVDLIPVEAASTRPADRGRGQRGAGVVRPDASYRPRGGDDEPVRTRRPRSASGVPTPLRLRRDRRPRVPLRPAVLDGIARSAPPAHYAPSRAYPTVTPPVPAH